MPAGFFSSETVRREPSLDVSRYPACGKCGLYKNCNSPRMQVTGESKRKVLIVAEAPGKTEDDEGVQLVGDAGQRLRQHLKKLGWDLDRDCWKTNSIICRPQGNVIADKYIEACRPNLTRTMRELEPRVVILLGLSSVKSLIGMDWRTGIDQLTRWVGWRIPSQTWNAWVCPTYHPSYLLRREQPVLDLWFRRHLKDALSLADAELTRPWREVPHWDDDVQIIEDPGDASYAIRSFIGDAPVAFDYESNTLKPDAKHSRIVCCSLSDGERTITYPWTTSTAAATREFLVSPTPKWGWNCKHEQRWTMAKLGTRVRNWQADGMLLAHVLDNRSGITSAKFQAYVQLGQPSYNDYIGPFLKAKSSNDRNRIREVEKRSLLLYCGMDSLVEHKVIRRQLRELEGRSG